MLMEHPQNALLGGPHTKIAIFAIFVLRCSISVREFSVENQRGSIIHLNMMGSLQMGQNIECRIFGIFTYA